MTEGTDNARANKNSKPSRQPEAWDKVCERTTTWFWLYC